MKTKKIIVLLFLLLVNSITLAQVVQEWVRKYNITGSYGYGIVDGGIDGFGNLYIASQTGTDPDILTIKYNSAGVQQWVKTYGYTAGSRDFFKDMLIDSSGNVYLAGYTEISYNTVKSVLLKYTSSGELLWTATNDSINDFNYYGFKTIITSDNNGNILFSGTRVDNPDNFIHVLKYNSSGNLLWDAGYYSGNYSGLISMTADKNGNVYILGSRYSGYPFLLKYNSSGIQKWTINIDTWGGYMEIDPYGNIIVSGSTYQAITLAKYDSLGNKLFSKSYAGTLNCSECNRTIVKADSSFIYLAGQTARMNTYGDYTIIKYNTSGIQQWVGLYDGVGNRSDVPLDLTTDNYRNVYVTGKSPGNQTGYDIVTIRYSPQGSQQWITRYNDVTLHDEGYKVSVDNTGNVYVFGISYDSAHGTLVTLKYSQQIGIKKLNDKIPIGFELYQNYPNPFNPKTILRFALPSIVNSEKSKVKLVIYNSLGQVVETLVNEELNAGTYEVEFDGTNLASGVYYYSLIIGNASTSLPPAERTGSTSLIATRKMVLLK